MQPQPCSCRLPVAWRRCAKLSSSAAPGFGIEPWTSVGPSADRISRKALELSIGHMGLVFFPRICFHAQPHPQKAKWVCCSARSGDVAMCVFRILPSFHAKSRHNSVRVSHMTFSWTPGRWRIATEGIRFVARDVALQDQEVAVAARAATPLLGPGPWGAASLVAAPAPAAEAARHRHLALAAGAPAVGDRPGGTGQAPGPNRTPTQRKLRQLLPCRDQHRQAQTLCLNLPSLQAAQDQQPAAAGARLHPETETVANSSRESEAAKELVEASVLQCRCGMAETPTLRAACRRSPHPQRRTQCPKQLRTLASPSWHCKGCVLSENPGPSVCVHRLGAPSQSRPTRQGRSRAAGAV